MRTKAIVIVFLLLCHNTFVLGADLASQIVGLWRFEYKSQKDELIATGNSVYRADNTFSVAVPILHNEEWLVVGGYSGIWKISGDKMTMEITKSNYPKLFPVNKPLTITILEINDNFYRYKMSDGAIEKEFRVK